MARARRYFSVSDVDRLVPALDLPVPGRHNLLDLRILGKRPGQSMLAPTRPDHQDLHRRSA